MLESDFWKDLAEKFRVLDPKGILYAHWTSFHRPHWELIRGEFPTLARRYEPLARRGGSRLDRSRDSLEVWLDAMKAEPDLVYDEMTSVETGEVLSCSIYYLCQRSGDFCNILESRAIEKERGTRKLLPKRKKKRGNKPGTVRQRHVDPAPTTRERIEAFILYVWRETGKKINKSDIWLVAGYEHREEFQRFQRDDPKTTQRARKVFSETLSLVPSKFLERLAKRRN